MLGVPQQELADARDLPGLREEAPDHRRGDRCQGPSQPPVQKPKTLVQAAEGAYKAASEAGLPPTVLSELHAELEARKAERDAEKPIATKLNSARAGLQKATTKGAKAKSALEEATEK